MLPIPRPERAPAPAPPSSSPPALLRLDASLVALVGAVAALPLGLAAGLGVGVVLSTFWSGVWGSAVRGLVQALPEGAGVLAPALSSALGTTIENAAAIGLMALGVGLAAVALDEVRTRLRPWDPAAARWFDHGHQGMVAGALVTLYAGGASASVTALVVPLALWACRPAPRPGESASAALRVGGLVAGGLALGQLAEALYTSLGPLATSARFLLAADGLSRAEVHRYFYLPFVRRGLAEGLGHCLGAGLFLAPVTAAVARGVRRALPRAPRLAVATLGALPALVLCWQLLRGLGLVAGHTWILNALREMSLVAPIASLQLWALLAWGGAALLPHLAAAGLGAGPALPEADAPIELPASAQASVAPAGLVASKISVASS